jgi:hypothetical protein
MLNLDTRIRRGVQPIDVRNRLATVFEVNDPADFFRGCRKVTLRRSPLEVVRSRERGTHRAVNRRWQLQLRRSAIVKRDWLKPCNTARRFSARRAFFFGARTPLGFASQTNARRA